MFEIGDKQKKELVSKLLSECDSLLYEIQRERPPLTGVLIHLSRVDLFHNLVRHDQIKGILDYFLRVQNYA